jgi:hypothetical protein
MSSRKLVLALCCLALSMTGAAARADIVVDWNAIALDTVLASGQHPADAAHVMATVHFAMFDAMSFVQGPHAPRYVLKPPKPLGRSGSAAAVASAHHVLSEMYPGRKAELDRALERSFAAIADAHERSNALIWGREIGTIVRVVRSSDDDAVRPSSPASLAALNRMVTAFIDTWGLGPAERVRLHALASSTITGAYARNADAEAAVLALLLSCLGP